MPTKKKETELLKKQEHAVDTLKNTAQTLGEDLSRSGLQEYVTYLKNPKRIFWNNTLAGIARGFGFIVGATIVVTLVTIIISYLSGIPIIGEFFVWLQETLGEEIIE